MTYQEKINASKELRNAILALELNEKLTVTYGTDYSGDAREYEIGCYDDYKGEKSYSIRKNIFDTMNISEVTGTQLKAYTYDMMTQRTTYNFPIWEMKLVEEEELEQFEFTPEDESHDMEFGKAPKVEDHGVIVLEFTPEEE